MVQIILLTVIGILKFCLAVNEMCVLKSGTIGICKPITECDVIVNAFRSGDLSNLQSCLFTGDIGIYCCPIYLSNMIPKLTPSCQKIIQLKENLRINSTKYDEDNSTTKLSCMTQILLKEKGFVGAGVLLSEKFVLTSAHSVYARRSLPIVRLEKNTYDEADLLPTHINVKQVILHELYLPREAYFDVALLLLKDSIKLTDLAFPVCLHNSQIELSIDQKFIRSEWNGNVLTKTEVQKVPNTICDAIYDTTEYKVKLPDGICNNLFCGTSKECNENSDGPIHVLINNTFFIYGFTTVLKTNCNSELPGLYTKISDVTEWIENILSSSTNSP